MNKVNSQLTTTVDVAEFCNHIENSILRDDKLVEFLFAYQKTKGKNLNSFIENYTAKLNAETEWVLTWYDIVLTHAHEKNGCNKIIRACTKVNKARATAEVKRVKEQTKADAKAKAPVKASKAKATPKALIKTLVKPLTTPITQTQAPTIQATTLPTTTPTTIQASVQPTTLPTPTTPTTPTPAQATPTNHLAKYNKFKVKCNVKEPACKWRNPINYTKKAYSPSKFNTGIPTGPENNLLVVDIDVKDEGVIEFQQYLAEFGIINTFVAQTPSGGYHYYFKYKCRR
jgi:hypothetical protein